MNKSLSLLALSIAGLFSMSSYAVEGGTPQSWDAHPYLVESQCTGTVLAGKYVLLARHCFDVNHAIKRRINLSNDEHLEGVSIKTHPDADVALWTISDVAPMDKVAFVADLNDPATTVNIDDNISFLGFGQDDDIPRLGKAINHITIKYPSVFLYGDPVAHSVPGDSGAPVFNLDNKIVGVDYAGSGSIDPTTGMYEQNGVDLHFVKDWLLTSIDRWHSATELKFTGSKTIEIQSLHVNPTNLADRQNAGTLTTGDVDVTGGSCVTDGAVAPFGMCTLELHTGGGEGHVQLEDGNDITINRAPAPVPQPDNGGSGGSMGWLGLLGLFALAWKRK